MNRFSIACRCGRNLLAQTQHAGRKAKCPGCGSIHTIPTPAQTTRPVVRTTVPPSRRYGALEAIGQFGSAFAMLICATALLPLGIGVIGLLETFKAGELKLLTAIPFGMCLVTSAAMVFAAWLMAATGQALQVIIDIQSNTLATAQAAEFKAVSVRTS